MCFGSELTIRQEKPGNPFSWQLCLKGRKTQRGTEGILRGVEGGWPFIPNQQLGKKVRCATARSDATPKSSFKAIITAVAEVAGIDAVSCSCGCYTRNVVSATTPQAVCQLD